jgi:hypothetical protein
MSSLRKNIPRDMQLLITRDLKLRISDYRLPLLVLISARIPTYKDDQIPTDSGVSYSGSLPVAFP